MSNADLGWSILCILLAWLSLNLTCWHIAVWRKDPTQVDWTLYFGFTACLLWGAGIPLLVTR